jgi:protein involved in polysaccharide export with SLBB domain
VLGEVKYPGPYTLKTKSERLSDVIERAGGLTADAYANGVVFFRKADSVGRVGVDLPAVLRDAKHVDNQVLYDGDSIYVPRYAAIVAVRGEVNSPVAASWVRGANIDYYVRGAGGGTAKGDAGKAYVLQPNGKVESRHRTLLLMHMSVPEPQPGSVVVVPAKDPTDKRDFVPVLAAIAQILGTVVTLVAITRR